MPWAAELLLIFGAILALMFVGVPVAFSTGLVAMGGILLALGPGPVLQAANVAFSKGTSEVFMVVPLFIFMAGIISYSGIAEAVFEAAYKWFSWVPGSLAVSSLMTSTAFAAVSGSSPATAATVGIFAVPEMIRKRYPRWMAIGSVVSGGALGILIPPSINMVIYGIITQTSIGKLFIAGIIPGLAIASLLIAFTIFSAWRAREAFPEAVSVSFKERVVALRGVIGVVVLFVAVMGSIYAGVATPTEAAAVGAGGSLVVAIFYHRFTFERLKQALFQSVETTSMVMFLLIGGFSLAYLIAVLGIGDNLVNFLVALNLNRWVLLGMFNVVLLILGCLLDPGSVIVITMPLLFPVLMKLGFNPVWLGVVFAVNTEIGMMTPPVGMNLFVLKSVLRGDIEMNEIVYGSMRYIGIMLVGLVIMIAFPILSLWLPSHM